jgi:DNA-binding transcriptional MerR regulator
MNVGLPPRQGDWPRSAEQQDSPTSKASAQRLWMRRSSAADHVDGRASVDFERALSSTVARMKSSSPDETVSIGDAAREAGVSAHTLRYYERLGLIAAVARGRRGERRYAAGDLEWISFLKRLRATGMPVREMARFAELRRHGTRTIPERARLLDAHAARIHERIAGLRAGLDAIDSKRAILTSAPGGR